MAHIRQELALGLASCFGLLFRKCQLAFCVFPGGDIEQDDHVAGRSAIVFGDWRVLHQEIQLLFAPLHRNFLILTRVEFERRPPGQIDLQTAAPVIRQKLRENAVRERLAQLVAKSRTDMQIAVLTRRLPFKYSGTLPKSENE